MIPLGAWALLVSVGFAAYTYAGYPMMLMALSWFRRPSPVPLEEPSEWPYVSITVPMYNEEDQAAALVESLLALDYPPEKRQILVVSDGSTDRTDEIVRSYANQGVEFLRVEGRRGKTAVENAASARLRGEIVVNTDASIRIRPDALKRLVAAFSEAGVGLASGRDVSVAAERHDGNVGESGYVGYEMWVRDLETAVSGIVGASGCFYAIRTELHRIPVPGHLSRDFAAALKCREQGYRAVSVSDAICFVPRTGSIQAEYQRKVRTITRGLQTLCHWRHLMHPFRHGLFAWKLLSHKVCRWGVPWFGLLGAFGLAALAPRHAWALWALVAGVGALAVGAIAWALAERTRLPASFRVLAFGVMGNVAAMRAAGRALLGAGDQVWEPTRREHAG